MEATNRPDPFELCEFYTCRDPDQLSLSTPEEAIEENLDGWLPDGDAAKAILGHGPITVTGYSPCTVPDGVVKTLAQTALELIDERLGEDFGDPDGGSMFSKEQTEAAVALLLPAVRKVCDNANVWACEKVATRTYSPEEVLVMMREHCPEWFEPKEPAT